MKTNKFLKVVLGLMVVFTVASCVQDDDYTVPSSLGDEENAKLNNLIATGTEISMAELKAMYLTEPNPSDNVAKLLETDIYVKGYVSSSDRTGNFFKEFFIQDSPSNPTIAIKIILNEVDTYNQFNFGREVYVSLKGVYVGEERIGNQVITLGAGTETDQYGTTVTSFGRIQTSSHIFRSPTTEEMVPLNLTISQLSSDYIGTFVQIDNAEFADNLLGKRYFDPMQDFDTKRTIQACEGFSYSTIQLETSSFASFRDELLPTGNGSIKAVLNKTYDGSSLIVAINKTEDVDFNGTRCTPLDISDFTVLVDEDFETAVNNTDFDFPGWTNFVEDGSRVWREKEYSGNGYIEFSTYGSGDDVNIAWAVTPGIDMSTIGGNAFFNFQAAQHHLDSPDNTLEIFVSTDFDGSDVLGATWEPVSAVLPTQSNSWYEMVDSGLIDISAYSGTVYVAFKVTGSGTDETLDGAYQIDNYKVLAN
ncbi:DUF5689 domain-containing protein [Xanthomarina sp. F2636L]|uniref:DUF5689 domain-containing protein n=1 Tax=Xanthomarina sp. F2636L TaxID=2996018 RepID=UPI00225E1FCF|nr:DUF5689 domain-containing protein [Xanthomarina sp. F2636L]MCX7551100.1 DUF5689 domain-containing protein [Xanthomarina sp. F2636L]